MHLFITESLKTCNIWLCPRKHSAENRYIVSDVICYDLLILDTTLTYQINFIWKLQDKLKIRQDLKDTNCSYGRRLGGGGVLILQSEELGAACYSNYKFYLMTLQSGGSRIKCGLDTASSLSSISSWKTNRTLGYWRCGYFCQIHM